MGARSVLKDLPPAPFGPRRSRRRHGKPTQQDQAIVEGVVANTPGGLKDSEVRALAKVMRKSPDVVTGLIVQARDKFLDSAERYVTIHKEAVEAALADGSAAALEQAIKGSQWAIENLAAEGQRIIDKPEKNSGNGVKIMVGVALGGLNGDVKVSTE